MSQPEPSEPRSPEEPEAQASAPGAPQAPERRRVHRAPNFPQFMIVGGLIGALIGLYFGQRGDAPGYSDSTAMALFAVLFGGLGVLIAAIVALILERRSNS